MPIPVLPPSLHVLERGWLSANSILFFDDDDRASVVDTGYVLHAAQTVALVWSAMGRRRLVRIVNTHLHSDHCGGNAALQATAGGVACCPITVPVGELQAVNDWDEDALSFRETGQHAPGFSAAASIAAGDSLDLGGLSWLVYAAPGHDPHALMLFQPEARILISGDALWERGFGVIFPEMVGEAGFGAARQTLQAIEALGPICIIPGHGAPFMDVAPALVHARARLRAFEDDPKRHARHGLRVLLKFQLLQHQNIAREALRDWFEAGDLVGRTVRCFWPGCEVQTVFTETLDSLVLAGAARLDAGLVCNAERE